MSNIVDVAYIYPAPYWRLSEHDWIKSLLLFFDEVAILLPDYVYGRHHIADPSLAEPLEDRGMLRVLEPNDWIDEQARIDLVPSMTGLTNTVRLTAPPAGFRTLTQSPIRSACYFADGSQHGAPRTSDAMR
ncbi:hypothetical protein [Pseudolysinimonas sp.]|uniref:hypothetical protein n=1 Tax=Pseudolysinimonas sp. TaxID=2680009 RepID=UPI00286B5249|nr:hypothetical protein [Pseudolysinimonas sp.]